jgi:hypothetical protein
MPLGRELGERHAIWPTIERTVVSSPQIRSRYRSRSQSGDRAQELVPFKLGDRVVVADDVRAERRGRERAAGEAPVQRRHEPGHLAVPVSLITPEISYSRWSAKLIPGGPRSPDLPAAAMMLQPRLRNPMNRWRLADCGRRPGPFVIRR